MVNYKGSTRKITVADVEINVPANATIKHLFDGAAGSSAADGMISASDGLIYQVTTGKTFRILGILMVTPTAVAQTVLLSTGDTENAETGTIITLQMPYGANLNIWISLDKTLASAKFLTYKPSSTGLGYIQIIGYEF